MEEPSWKRLKLSLERPYKGDNGKPLAALLDITPEGQHIMEPQEDPTQLLGEKLRRIFSERGADFFDHDRQLRTSNNDGPDVAGVGIDAESQHPEGENEGDDEYMSYEELTQMRRDIDRHLFIAAGEIFQAKELLNMLLPTSPGEDTTARLPQPIQVSSVLSVPSKPLTDLSPSTLAATVIKKPPPIASLKSFNAQLVVGGKDEGLRKAANVFKQAAKSMERSRLLGEQYWVNALKIRRANWSLVPAPLPYGSAMGKGADKTSKDFVVSFGLEESSSLIRRWAVGHLSTSGKAGVSLVIPHQQKVQLRVALLTAAHTSIVFNTRWAYDETSLDETLKSAQQEIVNREIFLHLIEEAGKLPSASARVSERLIAIEVAHGLELKFELVEADLENVITGTGVGTPEVCDLIYHSLSALLLRRHKYLKLKRLGIKTTNLNHAPAILQPVIDLIQYQVFCEKVYSEMKKIARALIRVGVSTRFKFDSVAGTGKELVRLLCDHGKSAVGGDATLRIDNRYTLRLSFTLPSSVVAHLSQATLSVSSIPQLNQLLVDEVNRCLLHRIHELGQECNGSLGGTWFVDLNRCIGRWDGGVINFLPSFKSDCTIDCSAFRLDGSTTKQGEFYVFSERPVQSQPLMTWVAQIIRSIPSQL